MEAETMMFGGLPFKTSEQTNELDAALAKAQGDYGVAAKNKDNPHFRSRYADLSSVMDATREALSKHGLSITQFQFDHPTDPSRVCLLTRIAHAGQWMRCVASAPVKDAQNVQAHQSAITYLRRYGWMCVTGIAPDDDDDGNKATSEPEGKTQSKPQSRQQGNRPNVPESRGDRAATQRPAPQQPASAPTQAPAPEQPAPGEDPLRTAQKAWHAELRNHCGDLNDADRHAFTSRLLGKSVKSEKEWKKVHYDFARTELLNHAETCACGEGVICGILAEVLGIPAQEGGEGAVPPPPPPPPTAEQSDEKPVCSRPECGKQLTRGQLDISVRAFGQPLCPTCQRTQAKAAA